MKKTHVVILGAGYGGLTTATKLQKSASASNIQITLVNKNDYHYETTWLHEVSAGTIKDEKACYSIESLLNKKVMNFVKDTVVKIEPENKQVILENGTLTYDYLVVSLGFESESFGIQGLDDHAHPITNIHSANKIFNHITEQFATYKANPDKQDKPLTIVVGGGGFTGIEFLGELTNKIPKLCKEFDIDKNKVKIVCAVASPSILPGFDPKLIKYAIKKLEKKGVEFLMETAVKEVTAEGVKIAKGEHEDFIETECVIWAAGVRGSSIVEASSLESGRGKVKVDDYLRAPGYDDVFVIGDCALVIDKKIDRPYPPTAQISMQEAHNLAKNITSLAKGKDKLIPFVYKPKGTFCSLGHTDGIGVAFGVKMTGFPASIMKKIIDNRALFMIGGPSLVVKKGKF